MIRLRVSRIIQKCSDPSISYQEAKWGIFEEQYFIGVCSTEAWAWGQSLQWAQILQWMLPASLKPAAAGSIGFWAPTAESSPTFPPLQLFPQPTELPFNGWLRLGYKGLALCLNWDNSEGSSQLQSSLWDRLRPLLDLHLSSRSPSAYPWGLFSLTWVVLEITP